MHVVADDEAPYEPAEHDVHALEPALGAIVPGAHAVQADALPPGEYDAAGHVTQPDAALARYCPGAHPLIGAT